MIKKTISLSQIHTKAMPAPKYEEEKPGSIVEHLSTSMKTTLLKCWLLKEDDSNYDFFNVNRYIVNKAKQRFYYLSRREFKNEDVKISSHQDIKLLIPKSPSESPNNIRLSIWPSVFLCDECSHIYKPTSEEKREIIEAESFPQCKRMKCTGSYKQTPHILQCQVCGSIRNIPSECKDCGGDLFLRKGSETDIETWRLECENGDVHDFKDYDVYWCRGEDEIRSKKKHEEITEGNPATRAPKPTVGKGISYPLTHQFCVGSEEPDLKNDELLFISSNSHLINKRAYKNIEMASQRFKEGGKIWKEKRDELKFSKGIEDPSKEEIKKKVMKEPADGYDAPLSREKYEKMKEYKEHHVKDINFEGEYDEQELLRKSEDWLNIFSEGSDRNLNLDKLDEISVSEKEIQKIENELNINQARYLEDISLVTGTYGVIRGSLYPVYKGKKLDPVKIPLEKVHYDYDYAKDRPKIQKNDSRGLPVIVSKRQTEGIVFTIKSKDILRYIEKEHNNLWSKINDGYDYSFTDFTEEEARNWIMYSSFHSELADEINEICKTILHTISHSIIRRFSRVSGLRGNDVGEMIFQEFSGFLIYNNLTNPLGMLRRVFKESFNDLVNPDIIKEIENCDMDPTCINQDEGAACHACLHTPEHVCENFNENLDRRVLIGENGYWK